MKCESAFNHICKFVQEEIIENKYVYRITEIIHVYLNYIKEKFPKFYNKNYKTEKLKSKLKSKFGQNIKLWTPKNGSDMIYTSNITSELLENSLEIHKNEINILKEAALIFRREVSARIFKKRRNFVATS